MRKIVSALLTAILCCVAAAPAMGCDKRTTPITPVPTEKKELMFEIDEGVGGYDYIAGYGYDRDLLDLVLDNTYEAVKDLMPKFDVSLLIFPQWYYDEAGWEEGESGALATLSPDFLYSMDFYEEKGIKVYLEIMASGIYCSSNGELGHLPLVNINHNTELERREVKGLGMDLATVAALKERYPETFVGLKIHELIGTHHLGLAGDPHGFLIYQEDVRAIIDSCVDNDLKLAWGDWDWMTAFENSSDAFWLETAKYAESKLGKDCFFIWANNAMAVIGLMENFDPMQRLESYFPNARVGLSNQDWFITIPNFTIGLQDTVGVVAEPEYPECDMPVELSVGWTRRAFELGADIIQYEAPYQFFNTYRSLYLAAELGLQNPKKMEGYVGDTTGYDEAPYYSARVEFKRFIQCLNDEIDSFDRVDAFYDRDLGKLTENLETHTPKLFTQSTVIAYGGEDQSFHYFDKYSNNPEQWLSQNENRFGDWILNEDTLRAARMAVTKNDHDSVLTAQQKGDSVSAELYNARSCLILRDDTIFADNEDGEFVSFTTANIIGEVVRNCDMDTDEVIVARRKNNKINFSIYKLYNKGNYVSRMPNVHKIGFVKLDDAMADVYMLNLIGLIELSSAEFVDMMGIRTRNCADANFMRPVEGFALALREANGVRIVGRRALGSQFFTQKLSVNGALTAVGAGDSDLDGALADEIVLSVNRNGRTYLEFYRFSDDFTLRRTERTIDLGQNDCTQIFSLKKSSYQRMVV